MEYVDGNFNISMASNPPPMEVIEYDHSWQDPMSADYNPLRVLRETPDMVKGRSNGGRPRPPPMPPSRSIRG